MRSEAAAAAASENATTMLTSAGVHWRLTEELTQPQSDLSFMQAASLLLAHLQSVAAGNPGRRQLCECLRQCHRRAQKPPLTLQLVPLPEKTTPCEPHVKCSSRTDVHAHEMCGVSGSGCSGDSWQACWRLVQGAGAAAGCGGAAPASAAHRSRRAPTPSRTPAAAATSAHSTCSRVAAWNHVVAVRRSAGPA